MSDQTPASATTTTDAPADEGGEYVFRQIVGDDLDGMSFEDAIAGTIVEFDDGDIVTGTVVKVDKDEVLLDIGYKSEGVIPARELSIRHDVDPARDRHPGRGDRGPRPPEGGQGRSADPVQEAGPVRAGLGHDRADQGAATASSRARSSRWSRAA